MTREQEEVAEANVAFYRAFESLDIRQMEKVWLRENYVLCIHPGWARISGWQDVISSWRRIFENTQEMRFELTEVTIHVQGALAWLTLYENITTRVEGETSRGIILTTNIFEKWQGRWWIIHHHGAPTVTPPSEPPTTLH